MPYVWIFTSIVGVLCWRFSFRFLWDRPFMIQEGPKWKKMYRMPSNRARLATSMSVATLFFWAVPVVLPIVLFIAGCKRVSDDDPVKFARIIGGKTKGMKDEERQKLALAVERADRELDSGI